MFIMFILPLCSNMLILEGMVEKWDPVLGRRDLRDPWDTQDPQYLRIPCTPGTPRPPPNRHKDVAKTS